MIGDSMRMNVPTGIIVQIGKDNFKVEPSKGQDSRGQSSCEGCAFEGKPCKLYCGDVPVILVKTDEPFKEHP